MGVEEKIDWARRAEAAALESDARVRNSEGAEFYNRQGRVAYASTGDSPRASGSRRSPCR